MKIILFLNIFLIFVHCNKTQNSTEPNRDIAKTETISESNSSASDSTTIILKDNKNYSEIKSGLVKSVSINQNLLTSKSKEEKTKYLDKDGKVIYEIKYKDGGFKVRDEKGKLLWKIKIYERKIKISDNEENLNPFEIKVNDENTLKLEKSENKIGEVIRNASSKLISSELNKSLTIQSEKLLMAHGVIFLNDIPESLRFLIFAELTSQ